MKYNLETVLFYLAFGIFITTCVISVLGVLSVWWVKPIDIEQTRNQNYACIYWVNDPDVVDARLKRHYEETGKDAIAITDLGTNAIYAHKPQTKEDLTVLGHEFLHVMWGAWHE